MSNRIRGTHAVTLAVLAAVAAPGAVAAPVSVNLRVEGRTATIFDGPVTTDGHAITTPSGGTHPCDGTNASAHPAPVPTATAALDDGARLNRIGWDADWFDSFEDFIVKDVNGERATASEFWGFAVNYKFASAGGCQTQVNHGDEVLWIFDAFSKAHVLKLTGPSSATTGAPVTVQVTDGGDGSPQAGASVSGSQTGADGRATLSFADAGVYRLKAERADSVRSNALTLCVDPPGADPCTSGDRTAPTVQVSLPGKQLASELARSRTIDVSWQAGDGPGAGVSHYAVEVREMANGLRTSKIVPGDWVPITTRTEAAAVRFRGASGKAYQFRVTAVDRAANRGTGETQPLVLPVDDRDRRLWRFSRGGWRRLRKPSAWGTTVMRPRRRGAKATFRFTGRRVALIGRELPRGGRVQVTVGGRSKVLRLRGRPAPRTVLWTSRPLRDGPHALRVRALGGGPVDLDAVAPLP
jgi:hypothetical protein